jgi:hypothetical protein
MRFRYNQTVVEAAESRLACCKRLLRQTFAWLFGISGLPPQRDSIEISNSKHGQRLPSRAVLE